MEKKEDKKEEGKADKPSEAASEKAKESGKGVKEKKKAKKSATIFVNELRTRLDTYYRIVVRNIRDSIPKVIGHFLVRGVQEKMQLELFKRLGQMRDAVNRALGEPAAIVQERKALNAQLDTLRKAERVLTRDPEITNLIGSTDDDLLNELKREKAEDDIAERKMAAEHGSVEMKKKDIYRPEMESASHEVPSAPPKAHEEVKKTSVANTSNVQPAGDGVAAPRPANPVPGQAPKASPVPVSPPVDPKAKPAAVKSNLFGAGKQ